MEKIRNNKSWRGCGEKENLEYRSVIKNPPAKQETQVQSLDQADPLEKEMAIHSSILAQEIPWTEEPGRLHSP